MTQKNQVLIPMIKPDIEALKKLRKKYHEGLEIPDYQKKRERLIEKGTRSEVTIEQHNEIITGLMELLAEDYAEGIFTQEEYKEELEVLEGKFLKEIKQPEEREGYVDGDIRYDENTLIVRNYYSNPENRIRLLNKKGVNYLMKKTSETTTIILENTKFIYTHSTSFPRHKLFLFVNVKRDVEKWLGTRPKIQLPPKHEVTVYNYDYDDSYGEICGTDLDHAYWKIAYNKGMISENTYNFGLDPSCKALRLATISVLGRERSYYKYIDGKIDHKVIIEPADPNLQAIFKYVRFFCYQMMFELSKMLKDDFDCWQTDCIYYRNTPENVELVHKFLTERDLTFKQLEFDGTEDEEE